MLWVAFIAGTFLGANLGLVITCMIVATRKREDMLLEKNNHIEHAMMDELQDLRLKRPFESVSKPAPYAGTIGS